MVRVDAEIVAEVRRLAVEGDRPLNRQVEGILRIGLATSSADRQSNRGKKASTSTGTH